MEEVHVEDQVAVGVAGTVRLRRGGGSGHFYIM